MTTSERLAQLAEQGEGEITLGPEEGQDLEAFQATVAEINGYVRQGLLEVVGTPHRDSRAGQRHIDRVRIRLTGRGVQYFRAQ
jgi:hypothetical protein